jgi:hypothetical protein
MLRCRFHWVLILGLLLPTVSFAGVELPDGRTLDQVDFERHVVGLLGRAGCASGSCHGSFQGKGGLQLSLFGYDPAKDFAAITRDTNARRVNLSNPEQSLLLLKATGQLKHEGMTRFGKSSWQYQTLKTWIEQGAKWKQGSGEVKKVEISPPELVFKTAGDIGQLKVEATFADDSKENITAFCDFRTNDDAVAEVTSLGRVRSMRPGDTSIVVSYRGSVLAVRVMVPASAKDGFSFPKIAENNSIDTHVIAKLRRLNMVPSELASDEEFLRRVTIDTIGTLPTPEEIRKFLADKDPNKRDKKIEELLTHPLHAALWATKFSDITGNNTDALENPAQRKPYMSQMWHDWFRKRFQENMPYDEIVKGVLTATSREGKSVEDYIKEVEADEAAQDKGVKTKYAERATLDLFWRKQQRVTIDQWGEKTAAAFLGVRLECAQCHKHPFDRWTQEDYRAYANIFASLGTAISTEAAKPFKEANAERAKMSLVKVNELRKMGKPIPAMPLAPLREVFTLPRPTGLMVHPDTGKLLDPKALGGTTIKAKLGEDPRVGLWQWMREEQNPFFARSFVNRVWGHYFGIGIVNPIDDFSIGNPPSNPKLLDSLAEDFVKSGFDIRALEKKILLSRTYQTSSTPNDSNRFDKVNFARSYVRPLMAEVVVDVLNAAMDTSEKWLPGEAPADAHAIEVGASRVQNPTVSHIFRSFGRSARTSACDCDRSFEAALPQKLFLMADGQLLTKLKGNNNRVGKIIADKKDDLEALDELYLATLSRYPTKAEKEHFIAYRDKKLKNAGKGDRRKVFDDAMWALMNTTEFIFNH